MLNNLDNKKKLIYAAAALLAIMAITVGIIFIVRSSSDNSTQDKIDTTSQSADSLKVQALESLNANETDKAKTLFQEAKQKYEAEGNTNGSVDMDAQLYLLEHK